MSIEPCILDHLDRMETQAAAQGPVIAFFDLDQTLINGYSALALAWENLRARKPGFGHIARELLSGIDRRSHSGGYADFYRALVRGLAGTSDSELRQIGELAFERTLEASVYSEARHVVQRHQQLGHRVVIVSAATDYQVAPIARSLGIQEFHCTTLKHKRGMLSGELNGSLCYGKGKLAAARRSARAHGAQLRQAWFYSDSRDDLPLLEQVGHPVATNPTKALAQHAQRKNWPQLTFCSRGKPNLESILRTALMANTLVSTAAIGAASRLLLRSKQKAANNMSHWLGSVGAAFAGLNFDVDGGEHLHGVRPAIFIFNHQSYMDSVVMAHLVRKNFVAFCKHEVADNKLLGPLLRAHGTIFVDRDANDQSDCMAKASQALRDGNSLIIAPEGTRSSGGYMRPFKPGAFYLAKKMQVPIIPVVLHNVADSLPRGHLLLRPARIKVTVLPPLFPGQIKRLRDSAAQLRDNFQLLLDTPLVSSVHMPNSPTLISAGCTTG